MAMRQTTWLFLVAGVLVVNGGCRSGTTNVTDNVEVDSQDDRTRAPQSSSGEGDLSWIQLREITDWFTVDYGEEEAKTAKDWLNRGVTHMMRKDYDASIADFTEAIELAPEDANAYHNRGLMHARNHNWEAAVADFTKAIDLNTLKDELRPVAYLDRGVVYHVKGDHDAALRDYAKVIELDAKDAVVFQNRAVTWYRKGGYDEALADVRRCRELGGTPPDEFLDALKDVSEE